MRRRLARTQSSRAAVSTDLHCGGRSPGSAPAPGQPLRRPAGLLLTDEHRLREVREVLHHDRGHPGLDRPALQALVAERLRQRGGAEAGGGPGGRSSWA